MHPAVLLGLLVGLLILVSWLRRAPPAARSRILNRLLLGGGILLLLFLTVTGRLNWLLALFAALVPLAQRALTALRLYRRAQSAADPSAGRRSDVETHFLRMSLDHDSGEMRGEVLEGRFRGRRLETLSLEELVALWRECRAADQQSAAVLEAYLDRVHGAAWQEAAGAAAGRSGGNGAMSAEEAYEILGLQPGASREDIVSAHRKLMQKLHPDRGGSTYLAAKINEAKAVLLPRA